MCETFVVLNASISYTPCVMSTDSGNRWRTGEI